jgi:hypothetical protein
MDPRHAANDFLGTIAAEAQVADAGKPITEIATPAEQFLIARFFA